MRHDDLIFRDFDPQPVRELLCLAPPHAVAGVGDEHRRHAEPAGVVDQLPEGVGREREYFPAKKISSSISI